jgi:predicted site-specific integrase-resolvase
MYTLQKAAAVLGISERTVRAWMKKFSIKGRIVETDRRRKYLTHSDMDKLVDHIASKVAENEKEKSNRKVNNRYKRVDDKDTYYSENTGERFYSLAGAASLLGVAVNKVQVWIKQQNIEKKVISTDRKRVYISYNDVFQLADIYKRKVTLQAYVDPPLQSETNVEQTDMDKLYSLKEAALCLNASQTTLRIWLRQDNIEKKTRTTDKRRIYITYKDVLLLADLHNREIVLNPSPIDLVEEVEEIKKQLKKAISDIENIKHDFRLFVKRSIYIG